MFLSDFPAASFQERKTDGMFEIPDSTSQPSQEIEIKKIHVLPPWSLTVRNSVGFSLRQLETSGF